MPGPSPDQPHDALTAVRYSISVDGHEIATFSELIGIISEVEPVEYLASTDKEVVSAKLPGKRKPPTLTLKRGKNTSMELWAWHEAVLTGQVAAARKSCSLVMYNNEGKSVARYHLENAWPSKIEIGVLKAGRSEVLTESVTIVCEHIQRLSV